MVKYVVKRIAAGKGKTRSAVLSRVSGLRVLKGPIPASLYPDMRVSADKHSAIIAKAAGECKHFLILKKN